MIFLMSWTHVLKPIQVLLHGFHDSGPDNDVGAPERFCQLVVQPDPVKITGNLVFVLLSPLSYQEIFFAYVLASVVRGLAVGLGVYLITYGFFDISLSSFPWIFIFALMGSALLGALGLIAGIWAEKFDQLATFQNFVILPLTFLSGVFYTIHSLPPFWRGLSHLNPFFYIIDGFRYGFFGVSVFRPISALGLWRPAPGGIMANFADVENGLQDSAVTLTRTRR